MCVFYSPGSEAGGRPATSTLNRFSALQQPSSSAGSALDSDRRVPQRLEPDTVSFTNKDPGAVQGPTEFAVVYLYVCFMLS